MSDRFVSGGTIGPSKDLAEGAATSDERAAAAAAAAAAPPPGKNSAEWEAVQKQLETERQRREEQRRKAATGEEKSLYDILQENKGMHCRGLLHAFTWSSFGIWRRYSQGLNDSREASCV